MPTLQTRAHPLLQSIVLSLSFIALAGLAVAGIYRALPDLSNREGLGFIVLWLTVSLFPGLIILQHALLLAFDVETGRLRSVADSMQLRAIKPAFASEVRRYQESRTPLVLATRYGIPAICTVVCAACHAVHYPRRSHACLPSE